MSRRPLFAVQGLSKKNPDGRGWLFKDINFAIAPHNLLRVQGASGSGKSTLLRCLSLLSPCATGVLTLNEQAPSLPSRYRSQVIYLAQNPILLGSSVTACLREAFTYKNHHHKIFDPTLAASYCERLGFKADLLTRPLATLSGGERQVVALMRGLLLRPLGLLLDEPESALDGKRRQLLWHFLEQWLQEEERFLVVVSHGEVPLQGGAHLNLPGGGLL